MANRIEASYPPKNLGVGWDNSALQLRLGEVTIEHRPIEAEFRVCPSCGRDGIALSSHLGAGQWVHGWLCLNCGELWPTEAGWPLAK